jgi:hypothetical protein
VIPTGLLDEGGTFTKKTKAIIRCLEPSTTCPPHPSGREKKLEMSSNQSFLHEKASLKVPKERSSESLFYISHLYTRRVQHPTPQRKNFLYSIPF